jgi:fatty acid-binding protein DegV
VALADHEAPDHRVDVAEVYQALQRDEPVKSRPPTAMAYISAIEAGDADAAVVLTPAGEFTPMRELAQLAVSIALRPAVVVDTRTAAAAQGLVVRETARAAASGADLTTVVEAAMRASRRAELIAALGSTATLAGKGWLPAPSWSGRSRRVRLFRLADGKITPVGDAPPDDVIDALVEQWASRGGGRVEPPVAFHAGPQRLAERLASATGSLLPAAPFSPAMTAHTGAGLVGLAWLGPDEG